jgi:hypothetical protein
MTGSGTCSRGPLSTPDRAAGGWETWLNREQEEPVNHMLVSERVAERLHKRK